MLRAKTHFEQIPLAAVIKIVQAQNRLQPAVGQQPAVSKKKTPAEIRSEAKQKWEAHR